MYETRAIVEDIWRWSRQNQENLYIKEMDHFNESVIRENVDIEYTVPKLIIEQSGEIISQYKKKYLN